MAINKQVWVKDIAKNLFPDNSFCVQGIDDTAYVENKTVNLNQAGVKPTVVRDRAVYPATITQRTDSSPNYDVHEYTTDPTHITDIDEIETNYAKRQNVLMEHSEELQTQIAHWMGYDWAPTTAPNFVRTSGDNRTAFVAGATGNRKKIVLNDFLNVKRIMDNMDVPKENRKVLMPAEMYNDLLELDKVLSAEYNQTGKLPTGVVNNLFGFDIWIRSSTTSYSNAATPVLRAPDANALTTANAAALFWHPKFVRYAKGTTKVYANIDEAAYYGSIFSAMTRAGGKKRYSDGKGVVALIEAAGA